MNKQLIGKIALFLVTPVALAGAYVFVKKVILKQPLFPIIPKKYTEEEVRKNPNLITKTYPLGTIIGGKPTAGTGKG